MFVASVEGPWLKHSFWKTRFLVDAEAYARLKSSGLAECWIDTSKGLDVARPKAETPIEFILANVPEGETVSVVPLP